MSSPLHRLLPCVLLLGLGQYASAQSDPAVLERILHEGKEHSQVWDTLTYMSEEIGHRLTGSAGLDRAKTWTRAEFERYGLENAHLRKWGDIPVRFDRGPSSVRIIAPVERELEFTTRSWGAGTQGPVRAAVSAMPQTMAELEANADALSGRWILAEPQSRRRGRRSDETDEEKQARKEQRELRTAINEALGQLDIAGRLTGSSSDLVHTGALSGWRELTMDALPDDVDVRITKSDYEVIAAALESGEEVIVEIDLDHHFSEGPFPVHNVVADIPGTERPEEVVIFSGHLDSWDGPGTQAAQDNGTGCSVMLEAARILMVAGVQPKRTIRFILWTGEEQGLFGSRAYVDSLSEEERAGISACFVDDGGTNYQGGVLCLESMKEMLDVAIAPLAAAFPELEMENTARPRMPRGGGSDHSPFNAVGIPGFFFKESGSGGREGKNYSFIHHTQHDTLRYAVPEYLVQSATCSAVMAYQLAQADTLLPREVEAEEEEEATPVSDPTFVLTKGELTGDWAASLVGPEAPDIDFTISLEMALDGRLRGELIGEMGRDPLKEGSWDAKTRVATFAATTDMGEVGFTATVEAGALVGTVLAMGSELDFRGVLEQAAETPISGTWKGIITSMDADITMVFAVNEGGEVSGRFQSAQSDSPLYDAKWDPKTKTITFEYDYPHAGRLPVVAQLEGERLVGTIGEKADFEATRE